MAQHVTSCTMPRPLRTQQHISTCLRAQPVPLWASHVQDGVLIGSVSQRRGSNVHLCCEVVEPNNAPQSSHTHIHTHSQSLLSTQTRPRLLG